MTDLDTRAKALYENCTSGSTPRWENLDDVTKGVWREEATLMSAVEDVLETGTGVVLISPDYGSGPSISVVRIPPESIRKEP